MLNSFTKQVMRVGILFALSLFLGCGDAGDAPSQKIAGNTLPQKNVGDTLSQKKEEMPLFRNSPVTRITLKDYSGLESGSETIERELDEKQIKLYVAIFDRHKDSSSDIVPPSPPAYKFTIYTENKFYGVSYIYSKEFFRFEDRAGFLSEDAASDLSSLIVRIQKK